MALLFGAISAFAVHWALTDDQGMVIKGIPLNPTWATGFRWCVGLSCVGVTLKCIGRGLECALHRHRVALTPDGLVVPVARCPRRSSHTTKIMGLHVEGATGCRPPS